jgi:ABC-type multidrug transport system fused ATPase/permease subunit
LKRIIKNTIAILNPAERRKAMVLIGENLVISILDIGFLACLLFIAQLYSGSISRKVTFVPSWLADRTSLWPIAFFFLLFAAKNLLSFLVYKAHCRFRYEVALRISYQNLLRYFEGGYNDYVHLDSSVHFSRVNLQPTEFSEHVMEGLQEILTEWTLIVLTVVAILFFNAKLFLLLLVLLLPPVIIAAWITRRQILTVKANIAGNRRLTMQRLEESIAAFIEANLYGKKQFFSGRYHRSQVEQNKHLGALRAVQGIPTRLAEVFAVFGLLALIAISMVAGHGRDAGFVTLGAFLAAAYKIIPGIARILNLNGQMRAYAYTLDDLVQGRGADAETQSPATGKVEKITSIALRDISFRYDERYILQHFDLEIETGCFLGIEGDSGRGKTTVLHLLLGFLSPEKGEVLFNGAVLDTATRPHFWRNIAYVKQQPLILQDTLRTNITLEEGGGATEDEGGRRETNEEKEVGVGASDQRLEHVLALSGLDLIAAKLPGGLNARIAENGRNISGGQRQRIAIARALYKKADVYILDEPFSELDEASEERMLAHFRQLSREGKIVILITHNKKSLSWCTRRVSLQDEAPEKTSARDRTFFL